MKGLTVNDKLLGYERMKAYPRITCFSTTRHGGYSQGNYASFNCNGYCGDDAADVAKNREMLCGLLASEPVELVIPHQTHSTNVRVIDPAWLDRSGEERASFLEDVDALVTDMTGCCLCVSTADCIPVLLYDRVRQVVAAVHAGWRGTVARIVERTLSVMTEHYGVDTRNVIACIGPGISLEAFEVGEEVYEAFREAGFDMDAVARKEAKWHIDLWEANRRQLLDKGVREENIEVAGFCTYYNNEDFFSARRQGIHSGRILSGIFISEK